MRLPAVLLPLLLLARALSQPLFPFWALQHHWRAKLGVPCPLRGDPPDSVRAALGGVLAGQEDVVQNITDAVQAWWDDYRSEHFAPLVLILTGSPGVGKTESAFAVARGLLHSEVRTADGGGSRVPLGMVEFRGEHFLEEGNVTAQREALRVGIARALYECAGTAVVVFDEIQKAHKPALTELVALMQGRHSRVSGMDASRMVIILTSDSAVCFIDELGAGPIARQRFNERLRRRLNEDFEEADVPLGSLATRIIPFQPLTWAAVRGVVAHHVQHARLPLAARELFDALEVDEGALNILSSMAYVPYTSWKCGEQGAQREETEQCMGHHAARREVAAGAAAGAAAEGGAGEAAFAVGAGGPEGGAAGGAGSGEDAGAVCGVPCSVHESCTSRTGSRAVMYNSESPVKRLVKLLVRGPAGKWLSAHALGQQQREEGASVQVRVQAVCALREVRTPNLCTKMGVPGAGLRVTRCLLAPGAQPACTQVWEGALP